MTAQLVSEVEVVEVAEPVAPAVALADAIDAEKEMVHHMIVATLIAVPVLVAFWVALVAVAVSFAHIGYAVPLAMGAGVGVLAGLFWGTWMGFVSYSSKQEAARHTRDG